MPPHSTTPPTDLNNGWSPQEEGAKAFIQLNFADPVELSEFKWQHRLGDTNKAAEKPSTGSCLFKNGLSGDKHSKKECAAHNGCTWDLSTPGGGHCSIAQQLMSKNGTTFTVHRGVYLGQFAGGTSKEFNLKDAMAKCEELGYKCRGVTCDKESRDVTKGNKSLPFS